MLVRGTSIESLRLAPTAESHHLNAVKINLSLMYFIVIILENPLQVRHNLNLELSRIHKPDQDFQNFNQFYNNRITHPISIQILSIFENL